MYDYSYSTVWPIVQSFIVILVFLLIFMIMVMWRIFEKTGNSGWKCLVPVYSSVVEFRFLGIPMWVLFFVILAGLLSLTGNILSEFGNINANWYTYLSYLINLPISIVVSKKMAERFGKSKGFAVGLFFLPIIFYPILAYGDAKYK